MTSFSNRGILGQPLSFFASFSAMISACFLKSLNDLLTLNAPWRVWSGLDGSGIIFEVIPGVYNQNFFPNAEGFPNLLW
jgi:hypothetical protein